MSRERLTTRGTGCELDWRGSMHGKDGFFPPPDYHHAQTNLGLYRFSCAVNTVCETAGTWGWPEHHRLPRPWMCVLPSRPLYAGFFSDCHHAQTNLGLYSFFPLVLWIRCAKRPEHEADRSTIDCRDHECVYYLHAPYTPPFFLIATTPKPTSDYIFFSLVLWIRCANRPEHEADRSTIDYRDYECITFTPLIRRCGS